MKWRWTDRVALGCFLLAVGGLVGFQILPFTSDRWVSGDRWHPYYGWQIWEEWWAGVSNLRTLDFEWFAALVWAAIHLAFVVFFVSPFVIQVLSRNRAIWWSFLGASACVIVGLTLVLGWVILTGFDWDNERLEMGFWLLMLAPPLHFSGVLFVRERVLA